MSLRKIQKVMNFLLVFVLFAWQLPVSASQTSQVTVVYTDYTTLSEEQIGSIRQGRPSETIRWDKVKYLLVYKKESLSLIPPTSTTSVPPTSTTSVPPTSTTSVPPTSTTSTPPTSTTSTPPTSTTSVPPTSTTSVPPTSTTSVPPTSTTSAPPTSGTPVPPTSSALLPSTGISFSIVPLIVGGVLFAGAVLLFVDKKRLKYWFVLVIFLSGSISGVVFASEPDYSRNLGDSFTFQYDKGELFDYYPEQAIRDARYVGYIAVYEDVPEPPKGSVVVRYRLEDGTTIRPDYQDTTNAPVGTVYDTAENATEKPEEISFNGQTYALTRVEGEERGVVTEGEIEVVYIYATTRRENHRGAVISRLFDKFSGTLIKETIVVDSGEFGTAYEVIKPTITKQEYVQAVGVPATPENEEKILSDMHVRFQQQADNLSSRGVSADLIEQAQSGLLERVTNYIRGTAPIVNVPISESGGDGEGGPIVVVGPIYPTSGALYVSGMVLHPLESGEYNYNTLLSINMHQLENGPNHSWDLIDVSEQPDVVQGIIDESVIYVDYYVTPQIVTTPPIIIVEWPDTPM